MKMIKIIKEKLHLLFHPTNIRSWILMWLFSAFLILILDLAIYYLLMTPLLDLEDFGPEHIWSSFKDALIIITIMEIFKYRKVFFKHFRHNICDENDRKTENSAPDSDQENQE